MDNLQTLTFIFAVLYGIYMFRRGMHLFMGKTLDPTLEKWNKKLTADSFDNKQAGRAYIVQATGIVLMAIAILVEFLAQNVNLGRYLFYGGVFIFLCGIYIRATTLVRVRREAPLTRGQKRQQKQKQKKKNNKKKK